MVSFCCCCVGSIGGDVGGYGSIASGACDLGESACLVFDVVGSGGDDGNRGYQVYFHCDRR